ncbi:MAG: ATP synthase F1 subunit gamma [Clostridia bacterium]|nr:ATP synthase F1 subunit gamma [Clostridia bacterium]
MSANIKRLKARIRSVDSTLHLTKAMQLVAAGKIRKATEQLANSRRYCDAMRTVVSSLGKSSECANSLYVKGPEPEKGGKTVLIVIAGDRGLAGGYNANAFRLADTVGADEIIPIGRRSIERVSNRFPEKLSKCGSFPTEGFKPEDSKALAEKLCERYLAGEIKRLRIVSTSYISIMSQTAALSTLLPISECELPESIKTYGKKGAKVEEKPAEESGKPEPIMEFEPDPTSVLNIAVPEYLSSIIYGLVRESFASEIAARRVAMDSATKNGIVMKDDLSLQYNRARQGAITQEIVEIVAGAGR